MTRTITEITASLRRVRRTKALAKAYGLRDVASKAGYNSICGLEDKLLEELAEARAERQARLLARAQAQASKKTPPAVRHVGVGESGAPMPMAAKRSA